MRSAVKDNGATDLHTLQEELKKLGISVVSGRQDTVISVKIKGLAGRALIRGLKLADQVLQEKIKHAIKACTDPATKLFTDPTFGPSSSDPDGAAAICKAGGIIPSKGGSQHQAKVLGLLQRGKIRWERPIYALDNEEDDNSPQEDEEDIYAMSSTDNVFASNATLFADGVSSGDVIQGNLGDCWFLSALSVVATRSDLLEQTFWRRDQHKSKGLFVCKFMKNFVWHYVLIDDRLPVFGFTDKKAGKPYFARCRNPNELWVSLLEKAYAKLHGSYEALIGGFVDCALNDLTGMCAEQVILKEGFPGFGENPYTPAKLQQKHGDPFWEKITLYKNSGTLMGCSIQPPVTSTKEVAVESSAGNGLYFKHAYALVDAAEIKTAKGDCVRLVKLRNPWGMGEWTGPWSDSSDERAANEDAIEKFFKVMKRKVGANADKRVFMTLNSQGIVGADDISQEEVIEINANDGTFFMSFDAWMQSFTHFFAGIDFPDSWHGRRSEGSWNEANCGGNTTKSTWINNPHFELVLEQRARIFASLSQEDPRGSENLKIVPVGFHICSLSPVGNDPNKYEIREPAKKLDAYYGLYKPADRDSYQNGKRPEPLPPAIIPGTVIPGIDDDGVPQAAYTFKQAVSVEATMEPGRYCIIPSMYMRTDKGTGNTNVGNFWISVYSDKSTFRLEGGEKIVEEEEGDEETQSNGGSYKNLSVGALPLPRQLSTTILSRKSDTIVATGIAVAAEKRRKFENDKEELLRQAKRYGVGLRELRAAFAKTPKVSKAECRHKLQKLGFSVASWDDDKIGLLFGGLDEVATSGIIQTDRILKLFAPDIQEEKMACELPDMEEDGDSPDSIHREGILEIELHGASGLAVGEKRQALVQRKVPIPAPTFSMSQVSLRRRIAAEILERDPSIAWHLRQFAKKSALLAKSRYTSKQNRDGMRSQLLNTPPVTAFYELLEKEYATRVISRLETQDEPEYVEPVSRTPSYSKRDGMTSFYPSLSPKSTPGWTLPPTPLNAVELHKSNRIRDLEAKRSTKLALLLQHKQQALGDAEKTASLPRLIGGRKSGLSHVKCVDCGVRVLVGGRSKTGTSEGIDSFPCNGVNCVNVFCSPCYSLLPPKSKLCEECYQHEISPEERFGEQLRGVLIEKIGASDQQRSHLEDVFRSFDVDGSGSLSPQEFEKMLQLLHIQPALTQGQKSFLVDQFDANGDGEISLIEFKHWILRDHVWVESAAPTSREVIPHAAEALSTVIAPLTTTECHSKAPQSGETGVIIFQRVIKLCVTSSGETNAAEKVFEQVDDDGSGSIDQFEFVDLLSSLGINLSSEDAILLMNRLDEFDYQNLVAQIGSGDFERRQQEKHEVSRELTFTKSPYGLITSKFHPELSNSMLTVIERVRADLRRRHHSSMSHSSRLHVLSLSMVESDAFVSTLRTLLSQVELPFFWSVSPRSLVLSIESEFLDQQNKPSFQQLVADTLLLHGSQLPPPLRALATFVAHTASSLLVRYEVVGKYTNVETSWQEFQDFISGHQNAYAVMELHPQGSLFTTRVARASGSGAVQWNLKTQIKMEEPKLCDHRIDRPVVFTDTVKASCIPGSTPSTENINFITGDSAESPGHFVVISVRRALPNGSESPKPRLYCTAYDPLTSCDYAVEGYPSDWPVDFFDVTVNPSFESQWQTMLGTMRLGVTITPKLAITVFNKQPKTDKLVGECEVSIGSAVIQEGHIFEERVALRPPAMSSTLVSAGVTSLTFRFDVKKTSAIVEDTIPDKRRHDTGTRVPIKLGAQYLAGEIVTPRAEPVQDNNDDRLKQLQASIATVELSKLEAQEQVKQLKTQVKQLSYALNKTSEDNAERWKRRLEQASQEQFAAEEQHAARLAALQEEIRHLSENEKQTNAPREASNLKDCRLSADASAHDILSAIRGILTSRCPERPYNGLKKALAAEAEVPGKVTFAVLNDVLGDFGLALSSEQRSTLANLFDPEMVGRVNIEDFFVKLCGDAEAYEKVRAPRSQVPTPEPSSPATLEVAVEEYPEPVVFRPTPPAQRPVSPMASPLRASGVRPKMSWQDMKKFLVLNLPEGWETRFTEKGRPYFCNHANRSTQWKHPRPEIETIFSEWVQANGAFFNRKSVSARPCKQK
ncbi:hypothetical protein PC121_g1149 [Phytophthora cactorum]|nr:hypothetical protein PC121_g1149 [Phytophthora cactorum]